MHKKFSLNKKHIVIEGPIGVGKSSLSKKIVETFGGSLFLEEPAENPFLERFYKSSERYGLPTQLSFLLHRVNQLRELAALDPKPTEPLIADFMIEKDPIFAQLTLSDEELVLYQDVFANLSIPRIRPDLVIYLQAPVKVLQQRIKKRNISYELKINDGYLERLSTAYTNYFHEYIGAPLLIVNAAEINPIDNQAHFQALMEQIAKINAGKHFFNPLSL